MELNYNFKIQTSELNTTFKISDDVTVSDIYIGKKQNWLNLELELNPSKDFEATLYDTILSKDKTIFHTNTLNCKLSNIKINNKNYYYKLVINTQKTYTTEELSYELNINDLIFYENNYYTNTSVYVFNDINDYMYTEDILSLDNCEIVYDSNYILITAPPKTTIKLFENIIYPKLINEYMFKIPSFYIKNSTTGEFLRCIESNVQIFNYDYENKIDNCFKYECVTDLKGICKIANKSFIETDQNLFFKHSTHNFQMLNIVQYFKIESNGNIIETKVKNDWDFKVIKNIDLNCIDILPNNYREISTYVNPNTFVNSLYEVNDSINDYGIIYKAIDFGIPTNHYANTGEYDIFSTKTSLKTDPRVGKKSMLIDCSDIEQPLGYYNENAKYIEFDSINYYLEDWRN